MRLFFEQCHEKTGFLISAFVFATQLIQSLFYLNPKFPASSHLLWLHSHRTGRNTRKPVYLRRGSFVTTAQKQVTDLSSSESLKAPHGGSQAVFHHSQCATLQFCLRRIRGIALHCWTPDSKGKRQIPPLSRTLPRGEGTWL